VILLLFCAATHTWSEFSLKYTGDRPKQPAYKICKFPQQCVINVFKYYFS